MPAMDQLLLIGEACRRAWEKRDPNFIRIVNKYDLTIRQLAYHIKYEASPGLVFQGLIENWTLEQIQFVVGSYRSDLREMKNAA